MEQNIILDQLTVNAICDSSGVFCGKNLQVSWKSVTKRNQGCGTVSGDQNVLPANINTVSDADLLDLVYSYGKK